MWTLGNQPFLYLNCLKAMQLGWESKLTNPQSSVRRILSILSYSFAFQKLILVGIFQPQILLELNQLKMHLKAPLRCIFLSSQMHLGG